MQLSSEIIDQIVRNVMRQMQSRASADGHAAPPMRRAAAGTGTAAAANAPTPVVRVDSKVVSEQVLADAGAAGRSITVPAGAVITPSGRDYIRRHAVRIQTPLTGSGGPAATGTMLMIGVSKVVDSAAAAAGWTSLTVPAERHAAAAAAAEAERGIVVCAGGEPSLVACLLNRNPAMRAAVITRATNLLSLAAVMNPRVICLDSSDWSFGELLRLLRSLKSADSAPSGWSEIPAGAGR